MLRFVGNFSAIILNEVAKSAFLEECSKRYINFEVRCVDVIAGSILITMEGTEESLDDVEAYIYREGGINNILGFPNIMLPSIAPTHIPTSSPTSTGTSNSLHSQIK